MTENDISSVLRKVRADGLVMSRVPKDTRDLFMKIAEEHFADDYGLTLTFLIDEFQRRSVLETLDIKLNYIISMEENKNKNEEKPKEIKKIKMIGGNEKKIEKEENQK